MRNKFQERLTELLRESKVKQKDLAASIGVSTSIVSDWIRKGKQPSAENVYLVSEFFNVSADFLLGRENWY